MENIGFTQKLESLDDENGHCEVMDCENVIKSLGIFSLSQTLILLILVEP